MPPTAPTPDDLRRAIDGAGNAADAAVLARYFRTGPGQYGEGDVFRGVKLSRLRQLIRPYQRRPFDPADWQPLLTSPVHEHRLAVLALMAGRAARGDADERERLYECYLAHTAYVNNWDLVDVSCAAVVGGYLLERDRTPLDRLAASDWLWDRRIAIVSTHRFLRAGQSADTYRIAVRLLRDPEDLIHKGVGWMLREAGKRVDRGELLAFLDRYAGAMPRTMLSYATEHLEPERRAHYRSLPRADLPR